jgi:DNA-binding response OmpR family regulator
MDKVWGYHGDATSRTLDTHVRRLREKLGDQGELVETVRSVGYRMGPGADG